VRTVIRVQVLSNVPHTPNSLRVEGFCAEAMPVVMRGDVEGPLSMEAGHLNEYGYAVYLSWGEKKKKG